MKRLLPLLLALLLPLTARAQAGSPYLALQISQMLINRGDTAAARRHLTRIAQQCVASPVWQDVYTYHRQLGILAQQGPGGKAAAIPHFRKAWEAFPEREAPDATYLEGADQLCDAYLAAGDYEQCEKVASRALVSAVAFADSCNFASGLMSVLARCYGQRGDTTMAESMHIEALFGSMRFENLFAHPDSADIYNLRMDNMLYNLKLEKPRASREHRTYLNALCQLSSYAYLAGNTWENIWVGERVLSLYDSYALPWDDMCHYIPLQLSVQYAYTEAYDKLKPLLAKAERFYREHPISWITPFHLYAAVGHTFAEKGLLTEARPYLKKAIEMTTPADDKADVERIRELLSNP